MSADRWLDVFTIMVGIFTLAVAVNAKDTVDKLICGIGPIDLSDKRLGDDLGMTLRPFI